MKSNFSEVSMNDLLDIENSFKTTVWSDFIKPKLFQVHDSAGVDFSRLIKAL